MHGGHQAQPCKFQKVVNEVNYIWLTEDLQRGLITQSFRKEAFT